MARHIHLGDLRRDLEEIQRTLYKSGVLNVSQRTPGVDLDELMIVMTLIQSMIDKLTFDKKEDDNGI